LELRKKSIEIEKQNENLKRKNDLLNNFAHVVSHDLKSPLNNIIGLANVLNDSKAPSPLLVCKFGGLIVESAENLQTLIEDVLDYSKSDIILTNAQAEVSIKTIVQDCLSHYKTQPRVKFTVADEYPSIKGHRAAWKQIIYNLVSNAIKHNDKDSTEIEISASLQGKFLLLRVSDNGPGIPENLVEKIFEPLVTLGHKTKNGESSSGIGLATLKKIVEAMQGEIAVKRNQPYGSIFMISVPFNKPDVS
jgi:signal transduction histidine kinase